MTLSDYQNQRVEDVRLWYRDVYCQLGDDVPVSIRYMVLWAIFNALYNIADYPKVALRSVSVNNRKVIPSIRGRNDETKLRFIARSLAKDNNLVASLFDANRVFINYLSQRTPEVQQPSNTSKIHFRHNGQDYSFDLSNLHGIASLDNRMFLEEGEVLFQYCYLDIDQVSLHQLEARSKFLRQLIFMLYQLRNNIVHGGSAAFFMQKKELTEGAIIILDSIVQYIFSNPRSLELDDEE